MARAFRRKKDRFLASLDPVEHALLCSLLEQTGALLDSAQPAVPDLPDAEDDPFEALTRGMEAALSGPGDDPALRRLLPEAHRDDPIAAAEFRQRRGDGVRQAKAQRLARTLAALQAAGDGPIELDREGATDLLVSLTDIRLVLGERLGLRTDDDADTLERRLDHLPEDDPQVPLVLAYDFLTWMQEGLALALSR